MSQTMPLWGRWIRSTVTNRAMVILTAAVAIPTIALAITAVFQYRTAQQQTITAAEQSNAAKTQAILMQRQLDVMQEQSESTKAQTNIQRDSLGTTREIVEQNNRSVQASEVQARSSEQSAKVAFQSLSVAQRSMYVSQSAYLVTGGPLADGIAVGEKPVVTMSIENVGNTPAVNVQAAGSIAFSDRPVTERMPAGPDSVPDQLLFGYRNAYEPAIAVIGPKKIANGLMYYARPLTADDINNLNSHKLRLYVWGELTYDDLFGFHHVTQFCYGIHYGDLTFEPCNGLNTIR